MSLVMSLAGTTAAADPKGATSDQAPKSDNLKHPLGVKQAALRQVGLEKLLRGDAMPSGSNKVVKVAPGQYVELAREGEDSILTVLGEFGPAQAAHTHGGAPVNHPSGRPTSARPTSRTCSSATRPASSR